MNQNWFVSPFPTPLNNDNFIALVILTRSGGRGGTEEDGGEVSEACGGMGGGGMNRILSLVKLIALLSQTFSSSSSSLRRGEIKALFLGPLLPSFL